MPKYVPYPFFYDDLPIDISFIFESERPAGKHGFMRAEGDRFVFEDGTKARFWGVNFNGGSCFPSHKYSEIVAERLAKAGCNIVRFHQMDAEWNLPNIFSYTRGKAVSTTRKLDPRSMDCLDYLIHCLKEQGIYCYLDMLTYRQYRAADGVENSAEMLFSSKYPYNIYDSRMIGLQKEFIRDIWNHYNPYTGLCYKDDPVFVMTEIINESELFSKADFSVEPYATNFRNMFAEWLAENGIGYDAQSCDLSGAEGPLGTFKTLIDKKYFDEMRAYMIDLGVKIPITGTNWFHSDALAKAHTDMDFIDSHTYFYDWNWDDHICMTDSLTDGEDCALASILNGRLDGKPFFVSEWDMPWPNPHRCESPLLYAAAGSYQDWSGFAIYIYSYTTQLDRIENILGKEILPPCVDGISFREGIFTSWNDPAKFGLFLHSALITRREDVKPAPESVCVKAGEELREAYRCAAEYKKVGVSFESGVTAGKPLLDLSGKEVMSIDGQLYRSWEKNYGYINSERTKAVYGRLGKNGEITMDGLSVKASSDHGVIAISSLSDAPLCESDNILITALCDAVNTDMKLDGDYLESYGKAPVLVKVMEAEIRLKARGKMRLRSVGPEAQYTGEITTEYGDGYLTFKLGDVYPGMYYLLTED